jgi:hypothetical protein
MGPKKRKKRFARATKPKKYRKSKFYIYSRKIISRENLCQPGFDVISSG